MLKKTVDVREPQTSLQDLLSLIREGAEVVLIEGTTPLARVVPIAAPSKPRKAGLHSGTNWTSEDFDEPLPEEYWTLSACSSCRIPTPLFGGTANQPNFRRRFLLFAKTQKTH